MSTDSSPAPGEQRRDTRVHYDFPVFFYLSVGRRKPRDVSYQKGYTQDISRDGIKLLIEDASDEVAERFSVDTHVGLEIYLPAVFRSKPLTCRGVVVWSHRNDTSMLAGVRLLDLDDSARETLKTVAVTLRNITDDILGDEESEAGDDESAESLA